MEPIENDVVEFFLQGGVGWVRVPHNSGTCFRQKKITSLEAVPSVP